MPLKKNVIDIPGGGGVSINWNRLDLRKNEATVTYYDDTGTLNKPEDLVNWAQNTANFPIFFPGLRSSLQSVKAKFLDGGKVVGTASYHNRSGYGKSIRTRPAKRSSITYLSGDGITILEEPREIVIGQLSITYKREGFKNGMASLGTTYIGKLNTGMFPIGSWTFPTGSLRYEGTSIVQEEMPGLDFYTRSWSFTYDSDKWQIGDLVGGVPIKVNLYPPDFYKSFYGLYHDMRNT
jgi:hypothetical protein